MNEAAAWALAFFAAGIVIGVAAYIVLAVFVRGPAEIAAFFAGLAGVSGGLAAAQIKPARRLCASAIGALISIFS